MRNQSDALERYLADLQTNEEIRRGVFHDNNRTRRNELQRRFLPDRARVCKKPATPPC